MNNITIPSNTSKALPIISELSLVQLAELYNKIQLHNAKLDKNSLAKTVKKFASKAKGIERVTKAISTVKDFEKATTTGKTWFISLTSSAPVGSKQPMANEKPAAKPVNKTVSKPAAEPSTKLTSSGKPVGLYLNDAVFEIVPDTKYPREGSAMALILKGVKLGLNAEGIIKHFQENWKAKTGNYKVSYSFARGYLTGAVRESRITIK